MTPATATYVYALLRSARRPERARRPPPGLPGTGPVRLLDAGQGLWLVVGEAPLDRYGAGAIERGLRDLGWVSACALAHERVVEHFSAVGDVVPMKIFTLFGDDARAVAHIARARPRLEALRARGAGRQEWGLRLVLDERRALERLTADDGGRRAARTGTAFLARKQRRRAAARRLAADARAEAERVFAALARRAVDARRRTPVQGAAGRVVVLDAAFLVPARRAAAFRAAVRTTTARLARRGVEATLTGPWPPYHFVSEP
jgi:hypothetical protein